MRVCIQRSCYSTDLELTTNTSPEKYADDSIEISIASNGGDGFINQGFMN